MAMAMALRAKRSGVQEGWEALDVQRGPLAAGARGAQSGPTESRRKRGACQTPSQPNMPNCVIPAHARPRPLPRPQPAAKQQSHGGAMSTGTGWRRRTTTRHGTTRMKGADDLLSCRLARLATPERQADNLQQFVPNYTRASLQLAWSSPHFAHLPPKAPDPWPAGSLKGVGGALAALPTFAPVMPTLARSS